MYITDSEKSLSISTYKYGNIHTHGCIYLCLCVHVCGEREARVNDKANGVKYKQQMNLGKENLGNP